MTRDSRMRWIRTTVLIAVFGLVASACSNDPTPTTQPGETTTWVEVGAVLG